MITTINKHGFKLRKPESILERREMVAGIREQDELWQISKQQRVNDDVSHGIAVLSMLTGSDDISKSLTTQAMSDRVALEHLSVTPIQFYRIIQRMKRPVVSVRKGIRGHGQEIKLAVMSLGGIREVEFSGGPNELATIGYYLGKSNSEVNYLRNTTFRKLLHQVELPQ